MTPTQQQFEAFQNLFNYFNQKLFAGNLPHVILNFSRKSKAYGFFAPKRWDKDGNVCHEISLNPSLLKRPMADICSTIVHEQCHLKVEEDGKASRNGYHSAYWASLMDTVGLGPSSTGQQGGKRTGQRVSHYIINDGPFAKAYAEIPKEYLLPWSCSDLSLIKAPQAKRSKYVCEQDGIKVYGKQDLSFKCGICECTMEERKVN